MKTCPLHCPNSLNLLIENFLCPRKFVFPLLTPCQHCWRINLPVLSVELQPSWCLFLHSTKAQIQTGSSLQAVDAACYQLQFHSRQHYMLFLLQDSSSFPKCLLEVCLELPKAWQLGSWHLGCDFQGSWCCFTLHSYSHGLFPSMHHLLLQCRLFGKVKTIFMPCVGTTLLIRHL